MVRNILILVLGCLFATASIGQEVIKGSGFRLTVPEMNNYYEYTFYAEFDSLQKEQAFQNAKLSISELFVNSEAVITFIDSEIGRLTLKPAGHISLVPQDKYDIHMLEFKYFVRIDVKDYKVRIAFSEFNQVPYNGSTLSLWSDSSFIDSMYNSVNFRGKEKMRARAFQRGLEVQTGIYNYCTNIALEITRQIAIPKNDW